MIHPWRALASARMVDDLLTDLTDGARHQKLVGSAEVGAPPDRVSGGQDRKAQSPSSITTALPGQPVCGQPPARGDQHRLANIVERYAMSCRQRLDRGDAGDDVVVEVDALRHRVEDPQRAVVQRRIAPREEGADAVGAEFAFERVGPDGGPRGMPVGDGLPVLGVLGARRVVELDEAVAGLVDEPLADLPPQFHQVALAPRPCPSRRTPACR